jgi:dipeptidase D
MMKLNELSPKPLWSIFADLCSIPRPSKHEEKVVQYVVDFATKHGLEYYKDKVGNVIIRKPATAGREGAKPVILQAHVDMVPQKNTATEHDFQTDPIQAYIDGEWVKAKGTTLGSDNGIGVAAAMAVLQSNDLVHGPLEVLLTIDEETGMTGAFNLEAGALKGNTMINLDSEDEGELYIGCAGGLNTSAKIPVKFEAVPGDYKAFKLNLTGLKGGHSGLDINLGRGNANKLMNRFLWKVSRELEMRIASLEGGTLRNAIPRESFAVVVVASGDVSKFEKEVALFEKTLKVELGSVETDLSFKAETSGLPSQVLEKNAQDNFLNIIYALPNGAMRMIAEMPEVVETSTNLAIVKIKETEVELTCLLRSSVDSAKADLANAMTSIFALGGAKVVHDGDYPGWKPNVNSPVLLTMRDVYEKNFGKKPEVKVIHAGLECGIIGDKYPGMDMVSFGPTIRHPHSPDEKVNIPTVEKFWNFLVETLKSM